MLEKANKFTDLFAYTIQDHNLLLENAHLRHKTFLPHVKFFQSPYKKKRLCCKDFFVHLIKEKATLYNCQKYSSSIFQLNKLYALI